MASWPLAYVLLGATLHAIWNSINRSGGSHFDLTCLSLLAASACTVVVLTITLGGFGSFSITTMYVLGASSVLHAGYFFLLARAYKVGELSVVYPVSRALGVLTSIATSYLVLGERLSNQKLLGALLVCIGILNLAPVLSQAKAVTLPYTLALIGIAIGLAGALDKVGVAQGSELAYVAILFFACSVLMLPLALRKTGQELKLHFIENPFYVILIGPIIIFSYWLILCGLNQLPLHVVAPFREVSVILTFAIGVIVFRERLTVRKIISLFVFVLGLTFVQY